MDIAKQHWKILQELGNDLANRVKEFMVIGIKGDEVIVVTENGDGFWLGKMGFTGETNTATKSTPLNVPGLVQMAQNNGHILLLNKRGQIYTMEMNDRMQFKRNKHGQFQIIRNNEAKFLPQLISIPQKFTSVRCGYWHSLALTDDGKVWAWGENYYGQVGVHFSTRSFPSPRQITELDSHRVIAVECGGNHSLALTDQGDVYAWGRNNWEQLAYESSSSKHIPTQISISSPVKSMAAGQCHTLLLTQIGEVYVCEPNKCGRLSLPTTIKSSPRLSKMEGLPPISQIASNYTTYLSIAMSSDQRCFVWGTLRGRAVITTPQEFPSFYSTVESPLSFFLSTPSFYSIDCSTTHSVSIPETLLSPLSARMSRMFDNPETSDIQFVVEQRTIHAHRIILGNSSDYFARMFSERLLVPVDREDPIVRVTIPDHSYQVFHAFLRFLYTDSLEVYPDLLPELFDLATQYLESDLQQLCLSHMRTTITPATCCLYYQFTNLHSLPELDDFQQELVQFASTRMPEVTNSAAYQSMDDKLCKRLTLSMTNHSL